MGIERYLCVGGTEVANPNRTLAYMRARPNACQPTPPASGCCTCPDWEPNPCNATLDAGVDVSSPLEFCQGIFNVSGFGPNTLLRFRAHPMGGGEEFPCPPVKLPMPPPESPYWVQSPWFPLEALDGLLGCEPYSDSDDGCGYFVYELLDAMTGAVISWQMYLSPSLLGPGDPGPSGVSFDGGATWAPRGTHTYTGICSNTASAVVIGFNDQQEGDEPNCYGIGNVTGSSGPWQVNVSFYASADPTDAMPAADAPGWETEAGPVVSEFPPTLICAEDRDDGWWRYDLIDLGEARTFTVAVQIDSDELPFWRWSYDGGLTWGPPQDGLIPLEPEVPGPTTWRDPELDDAPWYDPAVPASAEVLGVWIEEARLGTSFQRQARQRLWGSSLGPVQATGRELTIVGWVYTASESASAYARQWLFEALQGGGCSGGDCELPDATIWTHCNPEVANEGKRTLKRVGLTGWDPDIEPTFPRRCGFKFEAVLTSEVPYLVTEPFLAVGADLGQGAAVCAICGDCPTPEPQPITCGCMDVPTRVAPEPLVTSCYCPPIQVRRHFVEVTPPRYWSDAAAVIRVDTGDPDYPGGPGLANLRIRGWANPVGFDAPAGDDPNPFECQEPCMDVEIGCLPPRSVLTIDASTKRATIEADGRTVDAYGYLSSRGGRRFQWPTVSCHGLMLALDADHGQTPAGATATIEFVTIERG